MRSIKNNSVTGITLQKTSTSTFRSWDLHVPSPTRPKHPNNTGFSISKDTNRSKFEMPFFRATPLSAMRITSKWLKLGLGPGGNGHLGAAEVAKLCQRQPENSRQVPRQSQRPRSSTPFTTRTKKGALTGSLTVLRFLLPSGHITRREAIELPLAMEAWAVAKAAARGQVCPRCPLRKSLQRKMECANGPRMEFWRLQMRSNRGPSRSGKVILPVNAWNLRCSSL